MEEKRKFFLTIESQLINVEEMIKLENHHSAAIIEIINSGKKQQQMLKLVGQNGMRYGILHGSKRSPSKTHTPY